MRPIVLLFVSLLVLGCSSEEEAAPASGPAGEVAFEAFDSPPEPVKEVSPAYPEDARLALAQGKVHVEVTVDEKGSVLATRVLSSSGRRDLDQAAEDAAKGWLFEPAQKEGRPVSAKIVIPFEFSLQ
jgi:protein TonB